MIDNNSHSVIEMALMDGTKRRVVVTETQDNQLSMLTSMFSLVSVMCQMLI